MSGINTDDWPVFIDGDSTFCCLYCSRRIVEYDWLNLSGITPNSLKQLIRNHVLDCDKVEIKGPWDDE